LILAISIPMKAATFYVGVNGSHFSPATLTIEVGDTVVWEDQDNFGDPHTTTSTLPFLNQITGEASWLTQATCSLMRSIARNIQLL